MGNDGRILLGQFTTEGGLDVLLNLQYQAAGMIKHVAGATLGQDAPSASTAAPTPRVSSRLGRQRRHRRERPADVHRAVRQRLRLVEGELKSVGLPLMLPFRRPKCGCLGVSPRSQTHGPRSPRPRLRVAYAVQGLGQGCSRWHP